MPSTRSRAMLVHVRQPRSVWKPVGVFLGTPNRLDYRMLPGEALDDWAAYLAANSLPPPIAEYSEVRGNWADWIGASVDAFTNGHDMWCTEIPPEVTLDATYEKYVLLVDEPVLTPKEFIPTANDIPDLSGYKKVRPV